MDVKSTITLETWDNVIVKNGELELSDNNSIFKIPDWKITRKIVDEYLKETDEEELEEIWKSIYDSPSYYEIDKENFSLKAQIDELKETIEQLESENDALRCRK